MCDGRAPSRFTLKLDQLVVPFVDRVKYLGISINSRTNCVDLSAVLVKFFGCFNNVVSSWSRKRRNVSSVFGEKLLFTYFVIWL